jgi:hypothetical protein
MLIAGVMLLAAVKQNVAGIMQLGYPFYICTILGAAKVLGSIGIVQNRFPAIREWAYAGYAFNLAGAVASHALHHDGITKMIAPVVLLILLLVSYRLLKKRALVTGAAQQVQQGYYHHSLIN